MYQEFLLLLAGMLASSLFFYIIGAMFLQAFKYKQTHLLIGVPVALVLSSLIALYLSEDGSVNSALERSGVSALIGSLITLVAVAIFGKRKIVSPDKDKN